MKLTIFNGSPRNKKSNSKILMEKFIEGFSSMDSSSVSTYYLANTKKLSEHVQAFNDAQIAIIIFPLYTDCMPGLVKEFIEHVASQGSQDGKRVGFVVQSGFPEAIHSVTVERYLKKLAARQNWEYLGTVIKGGVEGIQIMPPTMTKKLFQNFTELGKHFAETGNFSQKIVDDLRKPYKLSSGRLLFFKFGEILGLTNFYWNSNLKKNNAYNNRFAKPFA